VLIDARSVPPGSDLRFDLAIVGAGPAGIAMADRLRASGLRVCLLEGGGRHPDVATQRLYRGENVGHGYYPLDACRFRLIGGGSNRWGGWCRPLEPEDFNGADGGDAWPIDHTDLEPFYPDAAELFALPPGGFDLTTWIDRLPAPLPLPGDAFRNVLFVYSPELNFADAYAARIEGSDDVTTILHANVTELVLDEAGARVTAARVQTLSGGAFTVQARAVVLATGGIENARLLLASRSQRTAGLGNEHDLVGRYFMEHLHVAAGHVLLSPPRPRSDFYRKATYGDLRVRGVIAPTAAARRRHGLLGASIAIEELSYAYGTPFLGWRPELTFGPIRVYREWRHGPAGRAVEWVKGTTERTWNVGRRLETARAARAAQGRAGAAGGGLRSLYWRTEQRPSPLSRVTLSDRRRDALGVPLSRLDWRVGDVDVASVTSWLEHLDGELRRDGLGGVIMPKPGWEEGVIGGPHHMGTTRMAADPRRGVVDADCRVHSVDNLYVAGSSVFTTGGYANPTFTIVALALRLADHLRGELRRG